jgi:hypothetical protein
MSERHAPALDPAWQHYLSSLFAFDALHVRQKILAIAQKYHVTDAWGRPRFYVVRPPKLAINLALGMTVTILRLVIFVLILKLIFGGGSLVLAIVVVFVTNFLLSLALVLLSPYREIHVHTDETETLRVLTITQDNKIGFERRYTLLDMTGCEVARFRRDTLRSVIRRDWVVETPAGEGLLRVREDSWVLALLRRYLGPLWGALRTNFNFELPSGAVVGRYDRKLTLRDEYVLDLSGDPQQWVDRRVALAMAILLDTAESR